MLGMNIETLLVVSAVLLIADYFAIIVFIFNMMSKCFIMIIQVAPSLDKHPKISMFYFYLLLAFGRPYTYLAWCPLAGVYNVFTLVVFMATIEVGIMYDQIV